MQIWAVARQMIAEGIRMKIALVFLLLIGMVVLGLPLSIAGDASLTGAVQSFMSYGFTAAGVLLGMLTVFMSRSLSDEFVHRQILIVMTKPLPRWQFIVGKWLGITCLNAVFVAAASLSIYAMVHYIKATHPPIDDRYDEQELKSEVLVARHARGTQLPDFSKPAEVELQRNLEQGSYDNVPDFDPEAEKGRLAKKYEARWRIVGPRENRIFEFENVLCDRSAENSIHLRYKAEVTAYPPDEIFRAFWRVGNPSKGTPDYQVATRHVVGRYHTIRVPADAVAEDHTLTVRFYNENPFPDEPIYNNLIEFRKADNLEVLFIVGSFEGNMIRLTILMMCKLIFLAAVAVLMTTLFSFPVACLTSFTVYVIGAAYPFLVNAFDFMIPDHSVLESPWLVRLIKFLVYALFSDLSKFNAVEDFVNGRNVSLVWVLRGVAELVVLRGGILLGVAMLFFHRREVAEVSV